MQNWQNEIKRLLFTLAVVATVGYLLGYLSLLLALTLALYTAHNLYQLKRIQTWLTQATSQAEPPPAQSFGLWGDIFNGISRLQKRERNANDYLKDIISKAQNSSATLKIAVIIIDKNSNLEWSNKASEDLLGLKYPQHKSLPITKLVSGASFAEYFHTENYDEPLKINALQDNARFLEVQLTSFGEHERLMVVRDITQLHKLEAMRRDFVGNVSHELGTPITVFKGYLEVIMDNIETLDERWRKPVLQMHQQSNRMETIVRDLLLLSTLETGNLDIQQDDIELSELFREIKNDTQSIFQKFSHEFSIQGLEHVVVKGARSELYSALSNLAVNAAKYTPENGLVVIKASLDESFICIEIADNGIGIEAKHIPRLTQRFYRVDSSRSLTTGGTGLGLAIVKHILARHDGELEIKSEAGQGSRFICKLPISRLVNPPLLQPSVTEIETNANTSNL